MHWSCATLSDRSVRDGTDSYKWIAVGVIWLIALLNYADRMTIFSVFPVLRREMGFSDVTLALLGSTFLWTYAVSSPLGGYLGDRFSRRRVILFSLMIFTLITFASGFAQNVRQMIALRCLLGLSEAVFLPPALAYVASFHTERTRSLANSLALTGLTAGTGVGSWYGGFMAEHFSWRAGFFGLGAAGLAVAIVAKLLLREDIPSPTHPDTAVSEPIGRRLSEVLKTPTARALIFLAFALSLSSWPVHSWLPTYLFERFKLSLTQAGSVISIYAALPALVGGIAGGLLADQWTRHDARGRVAVQVIALGVLAPTLLALGFMGSARAVAVDLLIYSVARGLLECNSMPLFCSVLPSNRWSMAYGIYNFAGTLAGSLGIFLVGFEKGSWGIARTLSTMSILLVAAFFVMAYTMFRNLRPDIAQQTSENERVVASHSRSSST